MTAGGMVVVVPSELEAGFRLAGVQTVKADTGEEAETSVQELIARESGAVIGVYEPFLAAMSARERAAFESSLSPVVVPLPAGMDRHDEESHRARIAAMLSRAVGYHITFGEGGEQ